ncbi:MAG: DsrE family protein [Bacteroidetes bacterium]|nr:DsrE family protein [Bacteroidota bacterium]
MKLYLLTILLVFGTLEIFAQKSHRVVIQFSDSDSLSQASVVGQVKNIKTDLPDATIEVVCHGPGLDLLIKKNSKVPALVQEWNSKGVVFAACNNTMRRRGVKKEDLSAQATVVPSAMVELILKQEEGWSYVKGGH